MPPARLPTTLRNLLRTALAAALLGGTAPRGRAEPPAASDETAAELSTTPAPSESAAPAGDTVVPAAAGETAVEPFPTTGSLAGPPAVKTKKKRPPARLRKADAGPPTLESVLARLEEADEAAPCLSFQFEQTAEIRVTGETQKIRGAAHFCKPDHFRIEQQSIPNQVVVSDGKSLWVHNPGRRQVFVDSWENWSRAAGFPKGLLTFQMGTADLRDRYDIAYEGRSVTAGRESDVLKLSPRENGLWPYTFRLWIDPRDGLPFRTELESQNLRAVTRVTRMKVKAEFPDGFFVFQAPEGTAVFGAPAVPPASPASPAP